MTAHHGCPDLTEVLSLAEEAATQAGMILRDGFHHEKSVRFKGCMNPVTEYDLESEKLIIDRITSVFPDHLVIAEEAGRCGLDSKFRWYIDPLDGTTNFVHHFPLFAVSIAFEGPGPNGPELKVGVVYDPINQEMFTAAKNQGAFLNGRPISVSALDQLDQALLITGFPYDLENHTDQIMPRFQQMCLVTQGVRRLGTAALDLAWVAAGRAEGFWEERLKSWDAAAGVLLIREAGGRVTDFSDATYQPAMKEILATNGHLHYNILDLLTAKE